VKTVLVLFSSLVGFLTLGHTAQAGIRPLPPTTVTKGKRAFDLSQGYSFSGLNLDIETPKATQSYTPKSAWSPPFFTFRWGFSDPAELTVGPTGVGVRLRLIDPTKSDMALRAALGVHARLTGFYTSISEFVPLGSGGASLTLGGEWGEANGTSVRPYIAAHYEHNDLQEFAVSDLSTGQTSPGYHTMEADVSAGLIQPVVHISGGIDLPIQTERGFRVTPGLFVDVPVGVGPGSLIVSACSTCAVGVESVSTIKRPGVYATLRFEPARSTASDEGAPQ
jgi:hypothetical protein